MTALIIFIFLYFLRLRYFAVINLNEIKPNQLIRVYTTVDSLPQTKKGWQVFKADFLWIKTKNEEQFFLGERLKIVGKPRFRVINRFYKEIWLINPGIYRFESLLKNGKSRFGTKIPFVSGLSRVLLNFLDFIRRKSQMIYYKSLPEPQAGLLAGIVLGSNNNMDWDFWQALKKTGTLHIIAASGMNVTLIARVVIDFLVNFINRRKAYFVSIVCILIYCLLAGGSPAVIRAGLMASFSFLGLAFGREASGAWLLFLAAALMLLVNPFLIFDVGFQLSFMAMAGMIFLRPVLAKILKWEVGDGKCDIEVRSEIDESGESKNQNIPLQKSRKSHLSLLISNNLLDTLSAQIATFPILYFTFGQFQPFAFLANLFVLPLVPALMMLGFVLLICGLIWLPLSYPLAWLAWLPLSYFVEVIKWWGRIL